MWNVDFLKTLKNKWVNWGRGTNGRRKGGKRGCRE
jgi:hypothetical protein